MTGAALVGDAQTPAFVVGALDGVRGVAAGALVGHHQLAVVPLGGLPAAGGVAGEAVGAAAGDVVGGLAGGGAAVEDPR